MRVFFNIHAICLIYRVVSSTGALSLKEVPKTMVVIGGGVIGLEMGSVWSRLGAQVTVIEFTDTIVPSMDAEVRRNFQRSLTKQGFKFKLGTKVAGAKVSDDGVELAIEPAKGGDQETIKADIVLVATGKLLTIMVHNLLFHSRNII